MKNYLLVLPTEQHSLIKISSAKYGVSMKGFIIAAIEFYIDNLEENKKLDQKGINVTSRPIG